MNEALELEVGQEVLEVGTGCGWHAATVAEIVAPSDVAREKWGHVFTVEIVAELADAARKNIKDAGFDDSVTLVYGDAQWVTLKKHRMLAFLPRLQLQRSLSH